MRTKPELDYVDAEEYEEHVDDPLSWKRWCRLCAKEDDQRNISVFCKNERNVPDTTIATAIGKFFWVNIKIDDEISQLLCPDCHALITSLIAFTERVNKVQTMFRLLENSNPGDPIDPNELRLQYGLLDEERQHIIKSTDSKNDQLKYSEDYELEGEEHELEEELHNVENIDQDSEQDLDNDLEQELELENEMEQDLQQEEEEADHESSYSNLDAQFEFIDEDETLLIQVKKEIKELKKFCKKSEDEYEEEEKPSKGKIDHEMELMFRQSDDEDNLNGTSTAEEDEEKQNSDDGNLDETYDETVNSSNQPMKRKRGRPRKRPISAAELYARKRKLNDKDAEESDTSTTDYKFFCSFCPKKYKSLVVYRKHLHEAHNAVDETVPDYVCDVCGKVLPTERQLAAHSRNHLPLEMKQMYPCLYCDKKFTKESIMVQHINGIHLNEKPFICEVCGRALKTNAALNEHKLTHTNDCPFECEVCHKRFKNKARLKIHSDIHTPTGYTCTICGLQLNTRRTLNMHMLVHSEEKPFKCDYCGNEFKRAKALKNHLIIHTGLKPYTCCFCNKSFANGSNCRSHKKKAHPEELAALEASGKSVTPTSVPKLDQLRAVTKAAENLQPINKQAGLPANWREILLKAEERANRLAQQKLDKSEKVSDDEQSAEIEAQS